jgi:hypothetical protein
MKQTPLRENREDIVHEIEGELQGVFPGVGGKLPGVPSLREKMAV